jgi:hypothetical protein
MDEVDVEEQVDLFSPSQLGQPMQVWGECIRRRPS